MTATQTAPPAPTAPKLWPQPIPIIGVTGEFASGKTLFGLTIDPKHTLVWDEEKSCESYVSLGFDRIDLFSEVAKKHPNGATPLQVFEWWLAHVRSIKAGQYRVGMLDTVGTIESGLVDWVESHPEHFSKTKAQYQKSSALMWGDVKEHWKLVLSDLARKFETFVFTSHMATVWKGGEPSTKRKPKGKETLMELASLYLMMERKPDAKGNTPAKPAAIVLKSRLASFRTNEATGEIETIPTLPPRLPVCTPHEIRRYMLTPPDYSKLSDAEKAPDLDKLTDDERLQLQTERAKAEAAAEQFRAEREQRRAGGATTVAATTVQSRMTVAAGSTASTPAASADQESEPTRREQLLAKLVELREMRAAAKGIPGDDLDAEWKQFMGTLGIGSAKDLDDDGLADLVQTLGEKYDPFAFGLTGTQTPADSPSEQTPDSPTAVPTPTAESTPNPSQKEDSPTQTTPA